MEETPKKTQDRADDRLDAWLDEHDAALLWWTALPGSLSGKHICCYRVGAGTLLVERDHVGWEVWLPASDSTLIDDNFRAMEKALGLAPKAPDPIEVLRELFAALTAKDAFEVDHDAGALVENPKITAALVRAQAVLDAATPPRWRRPYSPPAIEPTTAAERVALLRNALQPVQTYLDLAVAVVGPVVDDIPALRDAREGFAAARAVIDAMASEVE